MQMLKWIWSVGVNVLSRIWNTVKTFFSLHYCPSRVAKVLLAIVPFVLLLGTYIHFSNKRHEENPRDKILPTISQMYEQVKIYVVETDKRTDKNLFVDDTLASLKRLLIGVSIASVLSLIWGLSMGIYPWVRSTWMPFVTFVSIIPPLAILPIIFIGLGVEELGKISLIVLGITFLMTRDLKIAVENIPREQIVKALTLGASSWAIVYRIIFPQVMPRFIEMIRVYLSPAWLFLIAAEAIASKNGLAYRIFLSRRYLNMSLIIPIVFWITSIGFLMNFILKKILDWKYRWYVDIKNG